MAALDTRQQTANNGDTRGVRLRPLRARARAASRRPRLVVVARCRTAGCGVLLQDASILTVNKEEKPPPYIAAFFYFFFSGSAVSPAPDRRLFLFFVFSFFAAATCACISANEDPASRRCRLPKGKALTWSSLACRSRFPACPLPLVREALAFGPRL